MKIFILLNKKKWVLLFFSMAIATSLIPFTLALQVEENSLTSELPSSGEKVPSQEKPLPPPYRFTARPEWENDQCDQNSFKAAFITFSNDYIRSHEGYTLQDYDFPSNAEFNAIEKAKNDLPSYFNYATEGLGQLDTSYPLVTLPLKPEYIALNQDNLNIPYTLRTNAIAKDFYQKHPDEFDFLFLVPSEDFGGAGSHRVSNLILGIGLPQEVMGYNFYHGSKGKLQEIILTSINLYLPNNLDYSTEQFQLHEMGHMTCCFFGDELSSSLNLNLDDNGIHLNEAIQGKDLDHFDVMHSFGRWTNPNNPNWFKKLGKTEGLNKMTDYSSFHPFSLYTLGILPEDRYDEEFKYFDLNDPNFPHSYQQAKGSLSVNNLIEILGPRECIDPYYDEGYDKP